MCNPILEKRRDLRNDIAPVFLFGIMSGFKCIRVHTGVKKRRRKMEFYRDASALFTAATWWHRKERGSVSAQDVNLVARESEDVRREGSFRRVPILHYDVVKKIRHGGLFFTIRRASLQSRDESPLRSLARYSFFPKVANEPVLPLIRHRRL